MAGHARHITFVKKILADGSACAKCDQVEARLRESGDIDRINAIEIADERDPNSTGMRLAAQFEVDRAPFFVVETAGKTDIYTVYFKFAKEVLQRHSSATSEAQEILNDHPGLDMI